MSSKVEKEEISGSENRAIHIFCDALSVKQNDVISVAQAGGMTNRNFIICTENGSYILRVAGEGTSQMINRRNERRNTIAAVKLALHPDVVYCNPDTGIKISKYIEQSITLNLNSVTERENILAAADILSRLHRSDIHLSSSFVFEETYRSYYSMLQNERKIMKKYPVFEELHSFLPCLSSRLDTLGRLQLPCHNDLVPENWVLGEKRRLYLVDWEYAGINDPAWDIASFYSESALSDEQREFFLSEYLKDGDDIDLWREKVMLYGIALHMLWFLWTMLKEEHGVFFGDYGVVNLEKAGKLRMALGELHEK